MAKEKIMTFVQARSKLSEIVDRVAETGDAYVVSKRQKPRAVIIGIDRYREFSGTSKYVKTVRGKKFSSWGVLGRPLATSMKRFVSCASHGLKP